MEQEQGQARGAEHLPAGRDQSRSTISRKSSARSPALLEVLEKVQRVAPTDATVLITGETGTGKELIARAHSFSQRRADKPLIKLNCAALPDQPGRKRTVRPRKRRLHRRHRSAHRTFRAGATAARSSSTRSAICRWTCRPSCCASCRNASSSASAATQTIKTDVRIIAATNRDLQQEHRRRRVSRRSVLSPECLPGRAAAAARASRRYPAADAFLHTKVRARGLAGASTPSTAKRCGA